MLFIAFVDLKLTYPENFWVLVWALPIITAMIYFLFTKNFLRALVIFFIFVIMLASGIEDLFFYLMQARIPASMPHLFDEPFMGSVARMLGLKTVTPFSLITSVAIGLAFILLLIKILSIKKSAT